MKLKLYVCHAQRMRRNHRLLRSELRYKVLQCKCHGTPHVAEALGEGDTAQRLTQELEASPQA